MDKIVVPKEIYEALVLLVSLENRDFEIDKAKIVKSRLEKKLTGELEILNHYPFDDFLKAIVVGFRLKKTGEEFLLEEYEILKKKSKNKQLYSKQEIFVFNDRMQVIVFTLDVLNIKIKGIND